MVNPICFSNYFVNKQNVRSIEHIMDFKVLKKSNAEFLLYIFAEKSLVSELSSELLDIFEILQSNVKNNTKNDFKNYFMQSEEHQINAESKMMPLSKVDLFAGCWSALYETIPKDLIGSQRNMKIFKDLVRAILHSMKNQHIFLSEFVKKWDFKVHPWKVLSDDIVNQVLLKTLTWIFKDILSSIVCLNFFVTTCKIDTDENKLYFFWKNEWQSFYDKKISEMIFCKVISRFEENNKHKIKHKYSPQERLHLKNSTKEIPKLHLVLKTNDNYRPIVRYKNDALLLKEKSKLRERLHFLKAITGKPQDKVETKYSSFHSTWVAMKQPKLYFVKTDLSNAFGSINRRKLMQILAEKHVTFQKSNHPLYLKKRFTQIYQEMLIELRKPLLVRAGATVYKWNEGLVQGFKYSPALSELYYTYMDELYFVDHWKNCSSKLKLFVRIVDDYLYITNSIEDAQSFLTALSSYRNVNYDKTMVNFSHPTIKFNNEITFLGYSYNTTTLEVSRASTIFTGSMCYKITFSNAISDKCKFLENRIGQSGIQVNSHVFNFNYNKEELIWRHIFLTLCISANKFCTILSILCNGNEVLNYFDVYKKNVTVKLCNAMIDTLRKNKPKELLFVYCINHFRYLSFKALALCSKEIPKCKELAPLINIELAKTNCIFGKFREHASRIDRSGNILRPAVKEICRRTDLRSLIKQFEALPKGFECYNHKKFLNYH